MHLTSREQEKLMLFLAGELAAKRKAIGIKLSRNHYLYREPFTRGSTRRNECSGSDAIWLNTFNR